MIKCKRCGSTCSCNNSSVLLICPYCFEPVQKPVTNNVIKDLVFEYNDDVLVSSVLFPLIVSLLDIKQQKLLRLIRTAINKDIPKKMYNLRNESEEVQTFAINGITGELITETGMEIEDAKEIISYFTDALGYKIDITPDNYKQDVIFTAQSSLLANFDSSKIKIGDTITFGDVEWCVLDVKKGRALILSKHILHKLPYHSKYSNVTWGRSTIRKYLNGVFLRRFTIEEQNMIIEAQIINNDNLWYGTNGGRDTKDKIFLLSLDEVDNYFGNSGDYQNKKRKHYKDQKLVAENNGFYFSNAYDSRRTALFNNEKYWWWLRSPGGKTCEASIVDNNGSVLVKGGLGSEDENGGVRPALWVRL